MPGAKSRRMLYLSMEHTKGSGEPQETNSKGRIIMHTQKVKEFEFTLILTFKDGCPENFEDALFEAGCDDATLSLRSGIAYADFNRASDTLESAIVSAIEQVESAEAGVFVRRIEPSDFVTGAEIARRLNRSRQSVQQLVSGDRGDTDFPLPVAGVTSTTMLWSWQEVASWFEDKGKVQESEVPYEAGVIKKINQALELRDNPGDYNEMRGLLERIGKKSN